MYIHTKPCLLLDQRKSTRFKVNVSADESATNYSNCQSVRGSNGLILSSYLMLSKLGRVPQVTITIPKKL